MAKRDFYQLFKKDQESFCEFVRERKPALIERFYQSVEAAERSRELSSSMEEDRAKKLAETEARRAELADMKDVVDAKKLAAEIVAKAKEEARQIAGGSDIK